MPTSSFDKEFTLNTEEAFNSFVNIISRKSKPNSVDRTLASPEQMKQNEEILKELLSRTE